MGSIRKTLGQHRVIALDTCLWIYHFEQHPQFADHAREILTAVAKKRCRAVASELTLMELITGPLRLNRQDVADEYELLLSNYPNLTLVPISRSILLLAAEIRAFYGFKTPDAIILATAKESGASLIVTNDQRWSDLPGVETLCLSETTA
jgi:predicted nucleic acid-binding protein